MRSVIPSPTVELPVRPHWPPKPATAHAVEREIYHRLSTHPGLRLQSLVVHMTPAGVCLDGRVDILDPDLDMASLLMDIDGVSRVINRLMPAEATRSDKPQQAPGQCACEEEWGYHCG